MSESLHKILQVLSVNAFEKVLMDLRRSSATS
jgi:hypothetical protein